MKVKRGLFSYPGEEHLPRQNDQENMKSGISAQAFETMTFMEIAGLGCYAVLMAYPGQKTAQSCTLTAGHYFA